MNEQDDFAPVPAPPARPHTAGGILRAERERQGLTLETLAATLKVQVSKLESLEADRIEGLLDLTFARALAQSLCRVLKIDPRPVLALLPQPEQPVIEPLGQSGLNQPFRDKDPRGGGLGLSLPVLAQPMVLLALLLLLGAAGVIFWPDAPESVESPGVVEGLSAPDAAASLPLGPGITAESLAAVAASSAVPAIVSAGTAVAPAAVAAPHAAATLGAVEPAASAATAPSTGPLALQAVEASWVEVREAGGKVLISRTLEAGESLRLDGALPLSLTVGNVSGTQVSFRGVAVDLAPLNRGNVARLELP